MSTSTDAILFFGFTFYVEDSGEEHPYDQEGGGSWKRIYAERKGLVDQKDYDTFHALLAKEPCAVGIHGGEGCMADFVCIKSSHLVASRGYPEAVPALVQGSEWRDQLKHFCAVMGIPFQEPKWWLASLWL